MNSEKLLAVGGIALVLAGMIFGEAFAVFILHQNAARIGGALLSAARAVAALDSDLALRHTAEIGRFLENRATKVDAHVHVIDFGYLALLLALMQPFVALSERSKRRLALLFLTGAILLPVSVFLIYYVGLSYSPFKSIGWASISADFGGLLVIIACAGELTGLLRYLKTKQISAAGSGPLKGGGGADRLLLAGGALLALAGFLHGGYYAALHLEEHEASEVALLRALIDGAAANNLRGAAGAVVEYQALQQERAVAIAAHSHVIGFGLLAMMLALLQQHVMLSERWGRRWAAIMLLGSTLLPIFVLLETRLGMIAAGIADAGGLLVILSLAAMLCGLVRSPAGAVAESRGVK